MGKEIPRLLGQLPPDLLNDCFLSLASESGLGEEGMVCRVLISGPVFPDPTSHPGLSYQSLETGNQTESALIRESIV